LTVPSHAALQYPFVDGDLGPAKHDLAATRRLARSLEEQGYRGATIAEAGNDPFLPLAIAADSTERLELGTAIAVAFARNPMTLAYTCYDLAILSRGRFFVGLGSQVKAHIERRYSMPWSRPASRMREFVLAMRAIWESWQNDAPLKFEGDFYTHTLMSPFFAPGANPYGPPRVLVAAVGELMAEAAGEVADGVLLHGFTTRDYVTTVTLPALARGWAKADRSRQGYTLALPVLVATGETEEEMRTAEQAVRERIAFYGSTPSYRGVLDTHGWGDLQGDLHAMARQGRWREMGDLIRPDILDTFAVVGPPGEVATRIAQRYGGVVDRISFYAPYDSDPKLWQRIAAELNRGRDAAAGTGTPQLARAEV
jgi:probable F420-dependent oxidoreductase